MLGEGEAADAVAGGSVDGVTDGGEDRGERGLTQPRGGIIGLEEVDLDDRRDLVHAHGFVFVEIGLDGAALVDGDFVAHDGAERFEDGALAFVFGCAGIDDLAADVARDDHPVDLHLFIRIDAEFDDFGEVAAMGELEADTHGRTLGELALAPAGFFGGEFEHTDHARSFEFVGVGLHVGICDARKVEKIETELHGVFASRASEFIEEGLENPGEGVAAGGTHGVGGDAEGHEGSAEIEILDERAGKFVRGNVSGGREFVAFAETNEMILPGDEIPGFVDAAFEVVETGGAIVIVMEIVLAGPEKLYGDTYLLGDGGSFEHVIVGEATAETATGALHVDNDFVRGNVEDFGDDLTAGLGCLRGGPEFEFAVVIVSEAVFRLHGGMREEGIIVKSFDVLVSGF